MTRFPHSGREIVPTFASGEINAAKFTTAPGRRLVGTLAIIIATLLPGTCMGQAAGTGSVEGTVVDEAGAPVAGATVTVQRTAAPYALVRGKTGPNGTFQVTRLAAGPYQL